MTDSQMLGIATYVATQPWPPRVRGQTPAYLTTTISEFRDGKRGNSPGMADLLRAYSTDDVKAIVAYLRSAD